MSNKKAVLSLSGGMDSSVLLHLAAQHFDEIHTITFDYGQRHKREMNCVDLQIKSLISQSRTKNLHVTNKVIDVNYIRDIAPTSSLTNKNIKTPNIKEMAGDAQPVSYVPFRNLMFLSIACSYAEALEANTVLYGAALADSLGGYWDCSTEFLRSVNETISLNRKSKIDITAPLIDKSKTDIVKMGVSLKVNFANTWTCYSDREDGLADATTPSSSLRLQGFIEAGYKDPIKYAQQEQIDRAYKEKNCVDITF